MNAHLVIETAEQLGHEVFHLTAELIRITNQTNSAQDDIDAVRLRLIGRHSEIADALWDNSDVGNYDAGLRSAIATHLSSCASDRQQPSLVGPLQPHEAHALRVTAQEVRAGLGSLGHLDSEVRDAVAYIYDSQARLGEALRRSGEPSLLLV